MVHNPQDLYHLEIVMKHTFYICTCITGGMLILILGVLCLKPVAHAHVQDTTAICMFQTVFHIDGGVHELEKKHFESRFPYLRQRKDILLKACSIPRDILLYDFQSADIQNEDKIMALMVSGIITHLDGQIHPSEKRWLEDLLLAFEITTSITPLLTLTKDITVNNLEIKQKIAEIYLKPPSQPEQ